jgi:hypothetical protein
MLLIKRIPGLNNARDSVNREGMVFKNCANGKGLLNG